MGTGHSMEGWSYNGLGEAITFRAFSRRFYPKRLTIIHQKEKQQYISVDTVRMFIEPSAKH